MISRRLFGLLVLLVSTACGGSGLTDAPPDFPFPIDTTGPVGGAATTTSQQRMAALDAVELVLSFLPGQDLATETRFLVEAMRAMPQFAAVGAAPDQTVWAKFTNGMSLFIVHAGPGEATGGPPTQAVTGLARDPAPWTTSGGPTHVSAAPVALRPPARRIAGTVPASARFRLFDGVGSYVPGDPRADLEAMLTKHGYTGTREDATLAALRSVSGDGIFYMRAHAGLGSIHGDSTRLKYALWTATAADSAAEANDATLLTDLMVGRVVYMLFRVTAWTNANPLAAPNRHYGITEDFISHYMTFANNSFVYVDACETAAQPGLRAAFRNASLFAGWTERVLFAAQGPTARYVFDRMLGANTFGPEAPHQRPFDFESLPLDPKFGRGWILGYSRSVRANGSVIEAELTFHHLRGEFGILAPSIHSLSVNEVTKEVVLQGYFGNDPGADGKVTIDDGSGPFDLTLIQWLPDLIRAHLPSSGRGASGDVVVDVRGHQSNRRQLLEWKGTLVFTLDEVGSLAQTIEMDVRARTDPQDVRDLPGQPPKANPVAFFSLIPATQSRYRALGTFSMPIGMCTSTTTWFASGSIDAALLATSTESFTYGGRVDALRSIFELTVLKAVASQGLSVTATLDCPLGRTSADVKGKIESFAEIVDDPVLRGGKLSIELPLDPAWHVTAGRKQRSIASAMDPAGQVTFILQWPQIPPRPLYNPTLPR